MTEIIGYMASAIVLISFLMKNIKKLRIINTIGCLIFIVYGILLGKDGYPIIITNAGIVAVNVYYLIKTRKQLDL